MKIIKIFLLTLILFATTALPASASSLMDNLVPSDEEETGNVEAKYKEYPATRYNMDTYIEDGSFSDFMPWGWDEGLGKELSQGKSDIISIVWNWNILYSTIIGKFIEEVFSLNLIGLLSDEISNVIQSIAGFGPGGFKTTGIWPYLLTTVILSVGVWAMYEGIVKGRSSRAWSGLLSTMIIMVIALGFFAKSDIFLNGLNEAGNEVSNGALTGAVSLLDPEASYEGGEGYTVMRNLMFDLMIYTPYLYGQYGTADEEAIQEEWKKDGSRIDYILKNGDFTEERKDAVKYEAEEMENEMFKPESLNDRFILVLMVTIFNGIFGFMIALLAGSSVMFQFFAIVFALITPIAFLMALIPAFSYNAYRLLGKLVFCFLMKVAITMLIVVAFGVASLIQNALGAEAGYVMIMIINTALIIAIWIKRSEIFNVITSPSSANLNSTLGQSVSFYKQGLQKTRKVTSKVTAPFLKPSAPLAERSGFNKMKYNPGIGVYNVLRDRTKPNKQNHTENKPLSNRKGTVKPNSKAVSAGKQEAAFKDRSLSGPKKPVINRDASNVKAAHSPSAVVQRPSNTNNAAPIENSKQNVASLQETTDKGGWAYHNKKNPVEMKETPVLKDRLAERKASGSETTKGEGKNED